MSFLFLTRKKKEILINKRTFMNSLTQIKLLLLTLLEILKTSFVS
jgi:hypothetical protein